MSKKVVLTIDEARAKTITETEFLKQVIDLARLFRWRVAHFRPAMTAHGWRTAVQGDGAGFPDLLLIRSCGQLLVAELKVGKNKVTDEQQAWLDAFAATGIPAYVWRPTDWKQIEEILR
jgi:hypothetical protein